MPSNPYNSSTTYTWFNSVTASSSSGNSTLVPDNWTPIVQLRPIIAVKKTEKVEKKMPLQVAEQYKSEIMSIFKSYEKDLLLDILADTRFESMIYDNGYCQQDADREADHYRNSIRSKSTDYLHETLFACILQTNKSDAENNGFWIDKKGYHKIYIDHPKTKAKKDEPQKDPVST